MADPRTHLFTNNASCRLGEDLDAGELSLQVESGKGALFPDPDYGEIFIFTIEDLVQGVREICYCTERLGDVLTIERGKEGTSPLNWTQSNNIIVQHRITAGTLEHLAESGGGGGSTGIVELNTQSGLTYTLAASDVGKCVEMTNASANEVVVPANASVSIDVGATVLVRQMGAGATSIVEDTGVTVRRAISLNIRAQYSTISLHKRATNEWVMEGAMG